MARTIKQRTADAYERVVQGLVAGMPSLEQQARDFEE